MSGSRSRGKKTRTETYPTNIFLLPIYIWTCCYPNRWILFLASFHRFVKFEEDVENGGNRWSKPHVASLGLTHIYHLRYVLKNGAMLFDLKAKTLAEVADGCIRAATDGGMIEADSPVAAFLKEVIVKRHRHQYEGGDSRFRSGVGSAGSCLSMKMLAHLRSNKSKGLMIRNNQKNSSDLWSHGSLQRGRPKRRDEDAWLRQCGVYRGR